MQSYSISTKYTNLEFSELIRTFALNYRLNYNPNKYIKNETS